MVSLCPKPLGWSSFPHFLLGGGPLFLSLHGGKSTLLYLLTRENDLSLYLHRGVADHSLYHQGRESIISQSLLWFPKLSSTLQDCPLARLTSSWFWCSSLHLASHYKANTWDLNQSISRSLLEQEGLIELVTDLSL